MRTISKKTHGVLQLMRDNQGVAMIEFAFVAPLMAMLIVSGIELANYVQAHSRVSEIANTVADNAARVQSGVDESDITQVFAGANIIGSSIDFEDNGRVVLSSLQQNGRTGTSSGQMIEWQRCWGNLTTVAPAYGTQGKGKTTPLCQMEWVRRAIRLHPQMAYQSCLSKFPIDIHHCFCTASLVKRPSVMKAPSPCASRATEQSLMVVAPLSTPAPDRRSGKSHFPTRTIMVS